MQLKYTLLHFVKITVSHVKFPLRAGREGRSSVTLGVCEGGGGAVRGPACELLGVDNYRLHVHPSNLWVLTKAEIFFIYLKPETQFSGLNK